MEFYQIETLDVPAKPLGMIHGLRSRLFECKLWHLRRGGQKRLVPINALRSADQGQTPLRGCGTLADFSVLILRILALPRRRNFRPNGRNAGLSDARDTPPFFRVTHIVVYSG